MYSWLEEKYINLLSAQLPHFRRVKPGTYNFRCPICGDPQESESKARGYFYFKVGHSGYNFRCYNCGESKSFKNFMRIVSPPLHEEYVMERMKENISNYIPPTIVQKKEPVVHTFNFTNNLAVTACKGKEYLLNRMIPYNQLNRFYYTENFAEMVKSMMSDNEDKLPQDARIIIPFRNSDGELTHFQGRSIAYSKLRYVTVTVKENAAKVFGLDTINWKRRHVFVVEGPLDSLFIPNCLAMGGSDLTLDIDRELVYIFDNEPRNKEIVNRIKKIIERGYKICLFNDVFW